MDWVFRSPQQLLSRTCWRHNRRFPAASLSVMVEYAIEQCTPIDAAEMFRRYAVVYRLLHQVLIVVVSRAHSNVFSCLNLAAGISRLLVAEAKSIELTPERLLRKYAQVRSKGNQCASSNHATMPEASSVS